MSRTSVLRVLDTVTPTDSADCSNVIYSVTTSGIDLLTVVSFTELIKLIYTLCLSFTRVFVRCAAIVLIYWFLMQTRAMVVRPPDLLSSTDRMTRERCYLIIN